MYEKFAFVDTSIFLHYRPFDELDWLSLLGAKSVTLVTAPITVTELDQKKDDSKTKLRERAASVLKKLEMLWSAGGDSEVRPGVKIRLLHAEPAIDYTARHLDYRSQDDRLLASVLEFRDSHPGATVAIVTGDFGLRVKGRAHDLEVASLPEELKLSDEPDPDEKRIKELEREIRELKHAMPKLHVAFRDGGNLLEVTLRPPLMFSDEEIRAEKKLIRLKHKKIGPEPETPGVPGVQEMFARLFPPSKEAVDRYNDDLDKFYANYDRWLSSKGYRENLLRRTVRLELILENVGTAPANDIHIFLHFPDGFELQNSLNLGTRASEPAPPARPTGGIASESWPAVFPGFTELGSTSIRDIRPRNISRPQIKRTSSYDVTITAEELKHQLFQPLDPLYGVFDSFEQAWSFGFDYEIVAANVPKPVPGHLDVVIKKQPA
jgi:hypothetical protein